MFNWLRGRRLSAEARRKLLIVQARSEEAIIDTHVENVMEMIELLAGEIDVDRALEEYASMMPMEETMAASVTNRVLSRALGGRPAGAPAVPRAGRPAAPSSSRPGDRPFENVFRDGPPPGPATGPGGGRKRR
jgi:hypothetical protein